MRSLLFWLAVPFLIPQGLWIRRTAPRFAGAGGPNQGSVGNGATRSLVAVGDSIIAGVGASELTKALVGQTSRALAEALSCQINWTAHGYIGANSTRLLDRHLPRLGSISADFIIASVGVNDVTSLTTLGRWRRNLQELLRRLSAHNNDAVIAVAGVPPLGGFPLLPQPLRTALGGRALDFDREARQVIAAFPRAIYVPVEFETSPGQFAPDGYHPSEASYVTFGESMADKIVEHVTNR